MNKEQIIIFKTDIIDRVTPPGSKTFIVGGVPRDILNHQDIKDIDITTDEPNVFISELREWCEDTEVNYKIQEMSHAVLFRMEVVEGFEWVDIEVSTYIYNEEVTGGDRDFTCNAIYWPCGLNCDNSNPESHFIYPKFESTNDIFNPKDHTLVPVWKGCFSSNPVRIFRAADMISRPNGYTPSFECYNLARKAVELQVGTEHDSGIAEAGLQILHKIFHELVQFKRKWKDVRRALNFLMETGAWYFIHPDILEMKNIRHQSSYHTDTVWQHTIEVLDHLDMMRTDKPVWWPTTNSCAELLYWAALFHDIGKVHTQTWDHKSGVLVNHFYDHQTESERIAKEILKQAPLTPGQKRTIGSLILHHMDTKQFHEDEIKPRHLHILRKLLYELGDEVNVKCWVLLNDADCLASNRENKTIHMQAGVVKALNKLLHDIQHGMEPNWFNWRPPIPGNRIQELTQCDPRMISKYIDQIRSMTMRNPEKMVTVHDASTYIQNLGTEWKKAKMKEINESKSN